MVSVLVASAYLSVEREELGFHTRAWLIHLFNIKSAHISRVWVPLSRRTSTTPYIYLFWCSDLAWMTSSALLCGTLDQLGQGRAVLASGSSSLLHQEASVCLVLGRGFILPFLSLPYIHGITQHSIFKVLSLHYNSRHLHHCVYSPPLTVL